MRAPLRSVVWIVLACVVSAVSLRAQWLHQPMAGAPRTADGKINMTGPVPRVNGKPDLSGIWSGAGPMYRFNIAQDLETKDVQPWAEALFLQRVRESRKDSPLAKCMPVSLPYHQFFNLTRIVQIPALMVILHESPNSPNRTVFTDGRELPKDPNPAYMGYSVGKWEGDTMVVTTAGFNDKGWLDNGGKPATDQLKVTERFIRKDFGNMDIEITIDDPKAYTKPWTVTQPLAFQADTELLEYICNENNRYFDLVKDYKR